MRTPERKLLARLASIGPVLITADADLAYAGAGLATAHSSLAGAQMAQSQIDGLDAALTLGVAQASCADCSSGDFTPPPLPSSLIGLARDDSVLQTLAEVFQQAANDTQDADDATRFEAIAQHLASIAGDRVLHLTQPPAWAAGGHTVALRSDAFPDDGSPLAVVITAEDGGPWSGNLIDHHISLDALRAFGRALDPAATAPDDDDNDDDGLRGIHETATTRYVSPTDTGTDPSASDSDGDLFWDGTEVVTRSNPNDAESVPARVPVAVPVLMPWGAAVLLGLMVLGTLRLARRVSPDS